MSEDRFTYEDIEQRLGPSIAYAIYRHYRGHVQHAVVARVVAYRLVALRPKVERLLACEPQQVYKVRRELEDAARTYCERAKAFSSGYSVDDVYWYSAGQVDELKPMAMNPQWKPTDETPEQDGKPRRSKPAREGGDLLAMVMDVRRAGAAVGWDTNRIVDYLGGKRPKGLVA